MLENILAVLEGLCVLGMLATIFGLVDRLIAHVERRSNRIGPGSYPLLAERCAAAVSLAYYVAAVALLAFVVFARWVPSLLFVVYLWLNMIGHRFDARRLGQARSDARWWHALFGHRLDFARMELKFKNGHVWVVRSNGE